VVTWSVTPWRRALTAVFRTARRLMSEATTGPWPASAAVTTMTPVAAADRGAGIEAVPDLATSQSPLLLRVLHLEVKFTVHTPNGQFVTLGATEVATRARMAGSATRGHAADVNGHPGVIAWHEDRTPLSVLAFTVADGRITEITAVIDPAELALRDLPDPV